MDRELCYTGPWALLLFTAANTLPIRRFSSKLDMANVLTRADGVGVGVDATALSIAAQVFIVRHGLQLQWTGRNLGFLTLGTGVFRAWLLTERTRIRATS